ncbi:MAG: cytochrome c biogenesis protein CcdA, partial [Acidobacteria bacterium]|nr:cytochrome c biogenesis protein CcdA [Acidobacteriota bacterium]
MLKLQQWVVRNGRQWLVPGLVLLMAMGILLMITGKWNRWVSERTEQKTDDAYT